MDMESRCYKNELAQLVQDEKVPLKYIDDAVRRILRKKFEMGLFDDPFRFCNADREQRELNDPSHTAFARKMAEKSIVLLKNQKHLLPLSKETRTIALIGPLIKERMQNKGFWDVIVPGYDSAYVVSQWEGIRNKVSTGTRLLYAKGCSIDGESREGFQEALKVAGEADVVILSIGERRDMSGEARSRSNINIPGVQEELLKTLKDSGKPVIVLVNAGRPLVFSYTVQNADAILYTWWLGSEAGNAIADVLFGDYNPSARLTMTFPRSVGQIPIFYSHLNTGHPAQSDSSRSYSSAYIDESIYPEFEFGFGLGYTSFQYGGLQLSKNKMTANEKITVSMELTNTGQCKGEETVQLYLHDLVASVARPVIELRDFQKVKLKAGETRTLEFIIDRGKLSFYDQHLNLVAEPGMFELMIGASSKDIRLRDKFELTE